MAGQPIRRERAKQAEAVADAARDELNKMRLALVRKGLDPADFGGAPLKDIPLLTAYALDLPMRMSRMSSEGQSIEEIRVALGFTEAQEREWVNSYVDFASAIARTRAREEAFWQGQARQLAAAGDRPGFTAVSALIDKRFTSNSAAGNAADLVHVHVGKRLDKPVLDES